ncbi:syntaxin-8 [Coccinella septempunctata]|uniref:syntaxin-8 n=1 Tax=Coccinella septempunctata TaxID=41139 RepID=UPI001D05CC9B|nr:syntaxin-8 [Coccinella septempunctata]
MALLNIGEDPWLLEHETCEKLYREIMEQLTQRQRQPRTSDKFSQLSATIRLRLKQYNNEVEQLLQKIGFGGNLTSAELERRNRQVEVLKSKGLQMQKLFDDQLTHKNNEERQSLFGATSSMFDDDDFRRDTVSDIRNTQQKMIGEQERGLESLYQIISRQKNIAQTISNEVDLHNDILDDLDTQMERTNTRVRTETQNIGVIDRKDNTCGYWIVIILLFVSIVLVSIV